MFYHSYVDKFIGIGQLTAGSRQHTSYNPPAHIYNPPAHIFIPTAHMKLPPAHILMAFQARAGAA